MKRANYWMGALLLIALSAIAQSAMAAVCTTNAGTGTWGTASTWSCGHVPVAADTVVISRNITAVATTIAGLTVDAGAVLNGNNTNLTVNGAVAISGTYNTAGGNLTTTGGGALTVNTGGTFDFTKGNAAINGNVVINGTLSSGGDAMQMTGANTTLSGTGNVVNSKIEIDATGVTVPVGANLVFDTKSRIDVAANVNPASLTVNGTIDGTAQAVGDRIIRVSTGGTLTVGSTGVINAPNSRLEVREGASATNNGTITIYDLRGRNRTPAPVFTQGANSTLNINNAICDAANPCTFNASAAGNTVNYSGAAQTVILPSGSTYANLTLSGSGAKTLPTGITVAENFTMSGTATTAPTGALTVGGNFTIGAGTAFTAGTNTHTVSGNFDATGTFTPGTGTVTLNGATAQTISGTSPVNFNNLTVTNAASPNITLATNVTVAGTLTGTVTLTSTCPTDYTLTSTTPAQVLHSCPPTSSVISINLANASPTSAATVAWTVTFNQSVTGVDATAFTLAPTGVSGAYITSVTGSGTTWTVTANTGIGAGTLGLNQTGPGAVVPTLTGTFTGQVYTITSTPALAEYRMDEASWNGTANEVADSSGNGNHAQAFNSANTEDVSRAIPGSPGTCRNGVFDNGTTITQGYVQTPLPNLTTDFTATAWIKTTNNTIAGQRILIDDQGTAPGTGYGISLGDGAAGRIRFYSRGITPIILDSTYTIANNTWYFVAAVADIINKKRTIYVFSAAGALLASTTEAAWTGGAWGTDGGPVSIGAETNASAELPATYHFRGNLDEVRVYQKVLSQSALAAIATQTHVCPINVPDHLEIQSSGSGLTCAASTLTIKACVDAAIPCATPYTLGVSGTLSATGAPTVNWDGTTGGATGAGFVIPNGNSSVTKDVQVATAGTVTFGVASATPTPTSATACNFGTNPGNNNCVFTADMAGFIYSDSATGSSYTIPAQVSGIATPTLYLRALQASTTNPAVCTPAIIGQTTAVNMGYTCNNPVVCQPGNLATINATAIASGGTAVNLTFDANGSAPITARYDDVGQITLNASKTVTPFGGGTAITLNGNSNAFVVKPAGFVISGIKCSTIDTANCGAGALAMPTSGDNPAAADAAGVSFIRAGHPFTATVTAKNALGTTTKNYGQESTAESVKLTSALAGGLGLTNNPAISGTFGAFNNGVATDAFTWSEVGIITLTPSVADADYLGAGDVSGTTSDNVGRFYPDHLVLSGGTLAHRDDLTCAPASTFTYMGEPMLLTLTLVAQNVTNGLTQNYAGSFAKLDGATAGKWTTFAGDDSIGLGAVDGANALSGRLAITGTPTGSWTTGTGTLTAKVVLNRDVSADGAFDNLNLGVAPQDADGVKLLPGALDLDADLNASNERRQVATGKVRYGRVRLNNAYGSELLALSVPLKVEYYNSVSSGFVTNPDDSCTGFVIGNVALSNPTGTMTVGATTPSFVSNPVVAGLSSIRLSKPGSGKHGSVDVTLTVPAWLQYAWGSGSNPMARATFGVYKGNNEFIYLREAY